jgi:hypothetical protein
MISVIFDDMIGKNVLIYLDDITIYTHTFEEHLEVLKEVLERLRQNGLYLKPKKCTITTNSISFLDFIIDKEGLRTDLKKVKRIVKFLTSSNRTEVRAFLGIGMYYRHFIKDFATIAEPLHLLLRKGYKWT